jgi:spore germination protein Q
VRGIDLGGKEMNQFYNPYRSYPQSQPYGAGPMQPPGFPPNGAVPPPIGIPQVPQNGVVPPTLVGAPGAVGQLPIEQSYIENILRLNKGKLATVYATFENNTQWNAKTFVGIIEAAGRDHLILSDPETGQRILLPIVYLDYVTFDEELEYEYPFGAVAPNLATYPPR